MSGLTTPKIKYLLNNLVNFPEANYLEIGINRGATLAASLYKNNINSSYAIEISTLYNKLLIENKEKFNLNYTYLNEDCFKVDLSKIKNKINIYLFDGEHTYEDHYKSLEYYYSVLDNEFIFIVDDWVNKNDSAYKSWKQVSDATRAVISDLKLNILYEKELLRSEGYHGGFWVSLLKK
jgi:hypothetical protein